MGYGYGYTRSGRQALACDSCGTVGGVRKRPCRFKVINHDGSTLPWCPAPAVCGPCFKRLGGTRGIHTESACGQFARLDQEREDAIKARLETGDLLVKSASGDWADWVPTGLVGVTFRGIGRVVVALVPEANYDRSAKRYLSDYPEHVVLPTA